MLAAMDYVALPSEPTLTEKDVVKKLVILARMAAWLAVLIIIILSVVPGDMRPHVLGNNHVEHFVAYFISGCLFAIGYQRPMQWLSSGVLLTICAASLEFVQLWIPGRTASVRDFEVSTIGACIGLLIIVAVRLACERIFVVSYK
jgi:hypothetical protein